MSAGSVMFLDLARQTGWCEGRPGERPISGTHKLAPEGSESPAIMGGMIQFLGQRLMAFKPKTLVYEAPFDPRHMKKININTIRILWGLPGVVEGVAYRCGVYDVREANVNDIRRFLIGRTPKRDEAKQAVIDHLRALGHDPKDDNEADAIAGWYYACSIIDRRTGARSTQLFAGQQ